MRKFKLLKKHLIVVLMLVVMLFSCDGSLKDIIYEFTDYKIPVCVNEDASGKNNGEGWVDAYTSLSQAVLNAKDGDEIWICGDCTISSTITIDKNISIIGGFKNDDQFKDDRDSDDMSEIIDNVTGSNLFQINSALDIERIYMDGANDRMFTLNSNANLKFSDSIIVNYINSYSFISLNNNCSIDIINCYFENCVNTANGGIIHVTTSIEGCNINLVDSDFIDNKATTGGVLANSGGESNIIVEKCYFEGNEATAGNGGAIYNNNTNATFVLNINDSIFDSNSSSANGGAIYAANCVVDIRECTFDGNTGAFGNAIYLYSDVQYNSDIQTVNTFGPSDDIDWP